MRFFSSIGAVLLPLAASVNAIDFNPDDEGSIRGVCQEYAFGLMSHYKNNATGMPEEEIGIFPKPHYWWAAGAAWGGMIEYSQFSGDASYISTLTQALTANYGPNNNILLPWRKDQEGNDDQAFWALAIMSALEYEFPDPQQGAPATYLEVAVNAFNNIVARWNTESCGGGLKWQIYPENAYGYNYKNSISNGAAFALGARLARYTGNQTYADWAEKIFNWSKGVGLITDKYEVYDGAGDQTNCTDHDVTQWTYNIGMYLHGASVMYNFTKGQEIWKKHTSGLVDHSAAFFGPYENATDIMYEVACETGETGRHCNLDQQSFKAYLSRFLGKAAIMAPFTRQRITSWLRTSAVAAAKSCSGGTSGNECGSKWYTGGWDGTSGTGQQLSALEVTQALLMLKKGVVPAVNGQGAPAPVPSKPAVSSPAASSKASTPAPPATSAPASPTPEASAPPSEASSSVPAISPVVPSQPATTAAAVSSSAIPGQFPASTPAAPAVCSCKPSSTVTVYVPPTPPTAVPVVPSPPPVDPPVPSPPAPYPNGTVPVPPPANSTSPILFPGAASNTKVTGFSILGALAVAVVSGLL